MHGIGGHDAPPDIEQFQQGRHRSDLVAARLYPALSQYQFLRAPPRAQHMKRRRGACLVERTPRRLAVDRDHALARRRERGHEAREAGMERRRIKQPEQPAERIMAGYPPAKIEKLPQQWLLGLGKQRHVDAGLGPA